MKLLNNNILNTFPTINLCYNLLYNKVCNYNLIVAIPKGTKCFIWFKMIHNKPVCVLILLTDLNITDGSVLNYTVSNIYLLENKTTVTFVTDIQ